MLMQDGALVHVYDPKVRIEDALVEFKAHGITVDEKNLTFSNSAKEAVDGAHAVIVLTEWDEFKTYNYQEFYNLMLKPAFFFDGRNMMNHQQLENIGFEVHTIGKARVLAQGAQPTSMSDCAIDEMRTSSPKGGGMGGM